jgi:hypothetical protein
MANQWFYQRGGRPSGPIDSRELRRLAEAGVVTPETLVRQGDSARWICAENVRGLFQGSTPAPSSSPGTPPGPPPPSRMWRWEMGGRIFTTKQLLTYGIGLFLVAFAAEATRDLTRRFLRNDVPVTSSAVERSDICRTSVSSSAMRSVGYDQASNILEIEFSGGEVYQYFNVPAEVYRGLIAAESHGRYFHQHVRNAGYQYQKMN